MDKVAKTPSNAGPNREHRHEYFVQLDGLRGLAVGMVIVGHLGLSRASELWPWLALARLGVLVFFVLSGFLITTILLDERAAFGNVDLRAFYIRRSLRLLPAFFVFIAAMACLKALGHVPGESWGSFGAALLYVRNIYGSGELLGHIWSLSLEEQFYLLWPALLLAFPRRLISITMIAIAAVTVCRAGGIAWQVFDVSSGVFYMRPWFRFDSLMFGGIVAMARRQWPSLHSLPAIRRLTHPILVIPCLVAVSVPEVMGVVAPLHQAIENGLVTALFIHVLVARQGILRSVLVTSSARYLGKISYSLYLWQQPFTVLGEPSWAGLRQFPINVVVVLGLSILSQRYVEAPFLALRKTWGARSKAVVKRSLAPGLQDA